MSLNLKNEEEKTVSNDPVTENSEEINTTTEETPVVENSEETDIITEESDTLNETPPQTFLEIDYIAEENVRKAITRAERLEQFRQKSIQKEQEFREKELLLKLNKLSEIEKNAFLRKREELEIEKKIENNRQHVKNRREELLESKRIIKETQLKIGLEYQRNKHLEMLSKAEKLRLQREAEESAADAIREAEKARDAANLVVAEAERYAEEARRRLSVADAKAENFAEEARRRLSVVESKIPVRPKKTK